MSWDWALSSVSMHPQLAIRSVLYSIYFLTHSLTYLYRISKRQQCELRCPAVWGEDMFLTNIQPVAMSLTRNVDKSFTSGLRCRQVAINSTVFSVRTDYCWRDNSHDKMSH